MSANVYQEAENHYHRRPFSLFLPSKLCSAPRSLRNNKIITGGRSLLRTIAAGRTKRLTHLGANGNVLQKQTLKHAIC